MLNRSLKLSERNSFFLFGARGTGKSTLLSHWFDPNTTLTLNLLQPDQADPLMLRPQLFLNQLQALPEQISWIVIDEVQKIPALLDIVHLEIERGRFLFALTGSSARKLKRGGANMLGGRAFLKQLFPFTHSELGDKFNLHQALAWGTLPKIIEYSSDEDKYDYLKGYVSVYLREEILQEQITRGIEPFGKFLEVAAQSNGMILNFSKIARDVGISTKTAQSFFQILEDTLVGHLLQPYHESIRKRQTHGPKFYFFDSGLVRALSASLRLPIAERTYEFGRLFEQFMINEIHRLNIYGSKDYRLTYLRTKDDAEVDLIIERPGIPTALVEIKSTNSVTEDDVRSLQRFAVDFGTQTKGVEAFCLSLDPTPKKFGSVLALPWQEGLKELGL